jgi:hypothetical protein
MSSGIRGFAANAAQLRAERYRGKAKSLREMAEAEPIGVRISAIGDRHGHLLWPDEIDADRVNYQKLLEKWGSDEAIDDMEHAFGSLFWQMPERVPCVALSARTDQEANPLNREGGGIKRHARS